MTTLVKDKAHRKQILKGLLVLEPSRDVFREPSPDGSLALVFFDSEDVGQGHGCWRSRFAVVDAADRKVQEFGFVRTTSAAGDCAWAADSRHAAVAITQGILIWSKGKFACVRVHSWGDHPRLLWKDEKTIVARDFRYVTLVRGGGEPGKEKPGQATLRLDQLKFYPADRTGAIAYLLQLQPILTPALFND
jgi:hypothetical protein